MVNQQKVNARIKQCVKLGMSYSFQEDAYLREKPLFYVPILDLRTYSDEKWEVMIDNMKAILNGKEVH